MESQQCLMAFLANALDDPDSQPCGKCAVCLGKDLLSTHYSTQLVNNAIVYFRRSDRIQAKYITTNLTKLIGMTINAIALIKNK